jgi:predicted PurR-regulated permease PerM
MNTIVKLPLYAKFTMLLVGLYLLISMLSIAQTIILPLIYAAIIAILLSPVVSYLESKHVNRAVAVGLVLFFALLIIASIIFLILSQVNVLVEAWPLLTLKFQEFIEQFVSWVSVNFNVRADEINVWLNNLKADIFNSNDFGIGHTLTRVGSMVATMLLTPAYIIMFLYYQPHLIRFVHKLFGADNDNNVNEILGAIKGIIQSYLVGLSIEIVIVAVLDSIGLLLLGIPYAILLGCMGALLNLIPYVGGVIAGTIFMIIALLTKTPIYVLYVLVIYFFVQFIDNNFLVPKIVGSKVKLNALISILAVISGAALWGVPGMFLSIPLVAIVKLIADHIKPFKPWGFLLGDSMPPIFRFKTKE